MQTDDEKRAYKKGYLAGKHRATQAFGPEPDAPSPQGAEVEWYRAHGRFSERIRTDNRGHPYVIGDDGWNLNPRRYEPIEARMKSDGVYLLCGRPQD